jgi:anti-sigma regulatory factor (Ser/Thr protein kinase)
MPYYRCATCGLTGYSAAAYASANSCPTCQAALTEDAKLYVVPGAKHNVSCVVLARPEAAGEARRALVTLPFPEVTREDLALLVSELVTNSVRHAGLSARDAIGVSLVNGAGRARLAVRDGGDGFTPSLSAWNGPDVAGGRGLGIVDALSEAWGVKCDPEGCTVWCEVAVDDPEPAMSGNGTW